MQKKPKLSAIGAKLRKKHILAAFVAIAVGLVWLVPFLGVVMTALRPSRDVIYGWWRPPFLFTADNLFRAWTHPTASLATGLRNSAQMAFFATVLPTFIASLMAYGLARLRFPGRGPILMTIGLLLAIPQQMVAWPVFQLLHQMGLLNTLTGLILVHSAWALPWMVFFLRGFIETLPIELEEAAVIDGAGRFRTFFFIVFPLMLPALASAMVLQFTWAWNDFFMALVLVYDPKRMVVTQQIPLLRGQYHVDWGLLSAGALLAMLPPLLVFIFLQRYFVRGLVGGAVK